MTDDLIYEATDFDVKLGRGKGFQLWTGNLRYRMVIDKYREEKDWTKEQKTTKETIIDDVLEELGEKTRFLQSVEQSDGGFYIISKDKMKEKIKQALREKPADRKKKKRKLRELRAKQERRRAVAKVISNAKALSRATANQTTPNAVLGNRNGSTVSTSGLNAQLGGTNNSISSVFQQQQQPALQGGSRLSTSDELLIALASSSSRSPIPSLMTAGAGNPLGTVLGQSDLAQQLGGNLQWPVSSTLSNPLNQALLMGNNALLNSQNIMLSNSLAGLPTMQSPFSPSLRALNNAALEQAITNARAAAPKLNPSLLANRAVLPSSLSPQGGKVANQTTKAPPAQGTSQVPPKKHTPAPARPVANKNPPAARPVANNPASPVVNNTPAPAQPVANNTPAPARPVAKNHSPAARAPARPVAKNHSPAARPLANNPPPGARPSLFSHPLAANPLQNNYPTAARPLPNNYPTAAHPSPFGHPPITRHHPPTARPYPFHHPPTTFPLTHNYPSHPYPYNHPQATRPLPDNHLHSPPANPSPYHHPPTARQHHSPAARPLPNNNGSPAVVAKPPTQNPPQIVPDASVVSSSMEEKSQADVPSDQNKQSRKEKRLVTKSRSKAKFSIGSNTVKHSSKKKLPRQQGDSPKVISVHRSPSSPASRRLLNENAAFSSKKNSLANGTVETDRSSDSNDRTEQTMDAKLSEESAALPRHLMEFYEALVSLRNSGGSPKIGSAAKGTK